MQAGLGQNVVLSHNQGACLKDYGYIWSLKIRVGGRIRTVRREGQHGRACVGLSRGFGMRSSTTATVSLSQFFFLFWLLVIEKVAPKKRIFERIFDCSYTAEVW